MSKERSGPGAEMQEEKRAAPPDTAPLHVRTERLPDGRYCLLFTFREQPPRE